MSADSIPVGSDNQTTQQIDRSKPAAEFLEEPHQCARLAFLGLAVRQHSVVICHVFATIPPRWSAILKMVSGMAREMAVPFCRGVLLN